MIGERRPSPVITNKINKLKALGHKRTAQEFEKQILMTIQKGGALYHIDRALSEELKEAVMNRYPKTHTFHEDQE